MSSAAFAAVTPARLGELISSSESRITLTSIAGDWPAAFKRSIAVSIISDRRFVVRRRAREHAKLRIEWPGQQRIAIDRLPFAIGIAALDDRLERTLLRPFGRHDRLAVEVDVEKDGLRAGRVRGQLREYLRPVRRIGQQSRLEPAFLERTLQERGIALDVGGNVRDIRNREQLEELRNVPLRGRGDLVVPGPCRKRRRNDSERNQREQHARHRVLPRTTELKRTISRACGCAAASQWRGERRRVFASTQ